MINNFWNQGLWLKPNIKIQQLHFMLPRFPSQLQKPNKPFGLLQRSEADLFFFPSQVFQELFDELEGKKIVGFFVYVCVCERDQCRIPINIPVAKLQKLSLSCLFSSLKQQNFGMFVLTSRQIQIIYSLTMEIRLVKMSCVGEAGRGNICKHELHCMSYTENEFDWSR